MEGAETFKDHGAAEQRQYRKGNAEVGGGGESEKDTGERQAST